MCEHLDGVMLEMRISRVVHCNVLDEIHVILDEKHVDTSPYSKKKKTTNDIYESTVKNRSHSK